MLLDSRFKFLYSKVMQPNAPAPVPPSAPSQYDFILQHGENKPKRSILPGAGGSKKHRLLTLAIAGGILLIILVLIFSLLFGGKKTAGLLDLAQTQQEIIRVSTLGVQQADGSTAKNLAITTELSLLSDQQKVLGQMKKQGQKADAKRLAVKKNENTDKTLDQAALDNNYDVVFMKTIQTELTEYQQLLRQVHNATSDVSLQQILNDEFSSAATLIAATQNS